MHGRDEETDAADSIIMKIYDFLFDLIIIKVSKLVFDWCIFEGNTGIFI
ncbi:MAG: hypothetical protein P8Y99_16115 [Calditrichaceae bacterium]